MPHIQAVYHMYTQKKNTMLIPQKHIFLLIFNDDLHCEMTIYCKPTEK